MSTRIVISFGLPIRPKVGRPPWHVTVAGKSFDRDYGRIGNDRHSTDKLSLIKLYDPTKQKTISVSLVVCV
ncbi:hypothetical protein ACFWY9_16105, partial [Amycolatopsis sp. NPDC059027]|uniref:hypothetical protein n=1 Tax=Amycolatopsis sp. NPDC059027 TaxID=3346709 RepID=UPI0036731D62